MASKVRNFVDWVAILWLNIFRSVDERLNGLVHWLERREKCVIAHHICSLF